MDLVLVHGRLGDDIITRARVADAGCMGGTMPADRRGATELESVIRQSDLVQHQTGAVVSRTVLQKASGSVTAFAFDAGESLSEHIAPFDALVLVVEGEADVSISGISQRVAAGEILKLPAGQPHGLTAVTRFKMILVMIRA
jgi:quercetin dioxygenase-like cupin family protein